MQVLRPGPPDCAAGRRAAPVPTPASRRGTGASAVVEPHLPDRLQVVAAQSSVSRSTSSAAQASPWAGISRRNRHSSGVEQLRVDLVRDHLGRAPAARRAPSPPNSGALAGWFCRAATNRPGFDPARRRPPARGSSCRCRCRRRSPTASSRPASASTSRIGAVGDDHVVVLGLDRAGVDDGHVDALGPEVAGELPAQPPVAADHPPAGARRRAALRQRSHRARSPARSAAGRTPARAAPAGGGRRTRRTG